MLRDPVVVIEPGDYLDAASRMAYLRQKMAAEGRMEVFDGQPAVVRAVWNGAGTQGNTAMLLRRGVRTFDDAERAVAGGLDGR